MNSISTITQKGQVTIPVTIRNMLGLKPFDKLIFSVEAKKVVAEPIKESFFDLAGSVKYKGKKPINFKKVRQQMVKEIATRIAQEMKENS